MDHQLCTSKGFPDTVLWRPREGSSVILDEAHYRSFSHIIRTVHLREAVNTCAEHGMTPRPILSLCTLNGTALSSQTNHPCRNLHVLWFRAKLDGEDEDAHDRYGNVAFVVPTNVMMQRWKNLYLVEMVTFKAYTITRILATNSDYSSVLPKYDPQTPGGPWRFTPEGRHECLVDCRRYNSEGYNKYGHILEFMIEVTLFGMRNILHEATISFRNHHQARFGDPYNCHRFGNSPPCPSPFPRDLASRIFFTEHHHFTRHQLMATPRLSLSAEIFLKRFLAEMFCMFWSQHRT